MAEEEAVLLQCNYEELMALRLGARTLLDGVPGDGCAVAAPPAGRAEVEALVPRLEGDVEIATLAEQRAVESAVELIVTCLRREMEALVLESHPAHEGAVAAYFDFAHALAVLGRVQEIGGEMAALIEVVTGEPADDVTAATFVFPD